MVSQEDLFFTLVVDEKKERNVATFGIPGAYLHVETPKDKRVLMKIGGYFADIMFQVNPKYEQHVRHENG